jgi:hypothetical protein
MCLPRPLLLAVTVALVLRGAPAISAPLSSAGITFSDEMGGFTVTSVSGSGTLSDPFVVAEDITGPQEAVLVIKGFSASFGNRVGSHHLAGFALEKIVTNKSSDEWNLFEMELREVLAQQSPYGDGLSFGQASAVGRPFTSSAFPLNDEVDEPYDSVSFHGGVVRPGQTVTFRLIVTDTSPVSPFLLLQQPSKIIATGPRPFLSILTAKRPAVSSPSRSP